MGWDRNAPWMTCGEYEDACERIKFAGDPFTAIENMRDALKKAERILDRNLGHQTEKCYDALSIIRKALANEHTA